MSTHNIPFSNKKSVCRLSQICSYGIFSQGLKKFKIAVVNEPSVSEPLKPLKPLKFCLFASLKVNEFRHKVFVKLLFFFSSCFFRQEMGNTDRSFLNMISPGSNASNGMHITKISQKGLFSD